MPATATPAGRSQIAPRRSDQRPKSGCTSDDDAAEASISTAASVYESEKRSVRNGQQRRQRAVREVGAEMPGGERGHRALVDPDAHDANATASIARRCKSRHRARTTSTADVVVVPVAEGGEPPRRRGRARRAS